MQILEKESGNLARRMKANLRTTLGEVLSKAKPCPSPKVVINTGRRRTRAAGILFRNAISRATVTEHAIARATEQQYARSLAGRFRTTRWSVVLLSAQVAAEGRLGP